MGRILDEPGTVTISEAQVQNATGKELEQWKQAAEAELLNNFHGIGAMIVSTSDKLAQAAEILPMKAVWTIQFGGLHKWRGVVCGKLQRKDPTGQWWAAGTGRYHLSDGRASTRLA